MQNDKEGERTVLSLEERTSNTDSELSWSGLSDLLGHEEGHEHQPKEQPKQGLPTEHKAQIEVREALTHDEFSAIYRHKRPVLLRGYADKWPALSRWSDSAHLRELLGKEVDQTLVLRSPDGRRFLKRDCVQERWPFARIVDELFGSSTEVSQGDKTRFYARAAFADGLKAEVELDGLEQLVCGSTSGACMSSVFRDQNCGVWLGSAGCITPLHYDLCHGFLVGVLGTKLITYYSPDDFGGMYARKQQPEVCCPREFFRRTLLTLCARLSSTRMASARRGTLSSFSCASAALYGRPRSVATRRRHGRWTRGEEGSSTFC